VASPDCVGLDIRRVFRRYFVTLENGFVTRGLPRQCEPIAGADENLPLRSLLAPHTNSAVPRDESSEFALNSELAPTRGVSNALQHHQSWGGLVLVFPA
jgi:hypothetical protein